MPHDDLLSHEIDNYTVSSRICLLPNNHWINSMILHNMIISNSVILMIISNSVILMIIITHSMQLLDEKT